MKLRYNDKVHGYWLDGKRCKGVTTIAKIGTDTFSLDQWQKRQVAIGLAIMWQSGTEPARPPVKMTSAELDALCDDAKELAGANLASAAGTATHTLTERYDRGDTILDPDEIILAGQWASTLESAGLLLEPGLSERVVVFPEQGICGRFDRILRRKSDGALVVADLKTGSSAVRYPHAVATQLAMYANAPLMAKGWVYASEEDNSGETEYFEPLPSGLDKNVAYMIHLPDDGEAAVYSVNIKLGWKAVEQMIFPALRWRATPNKKLIKPVGR